jgi:hypothetical protein
MGGPTTSRRVKNGAVFRILLRVLCGVSWRVNAGVLSDYRPGCSSGGAAGVGDTSQRLYPVPA